MQNFVLHLLVLGEVFRKPYLDFSKRKCCFFSSRWRQHEKVCILANFWSYDLTFSANWSPKYADFSCISHISIRKRYDRAHREPPWSSTWILQPNTLRWSIAPVRTPFLRVGQSGPSDFHLCWSPAFAILYIWGAVIRGGRTSKERWLLQGEPVLREVVLSWPGLRAWVLDGIASGVFSTHLFKSFHIYVAFVFGLVV